MTDAGDRASQLEQELREQAKVLGGKFLVRTRDQAGRLRERIRELQQGDGTHLAELEELAHKIHGSGAMLGFAEVSACAGEIEQLAEQLMASRAQPDTALVADAVARLYGLVERLERVVAAAAS